MSKILWPCIFRSGKRTVEQCKLLSSSKIFVTKNYLLEFNILPYKCLRSHKYYVCTESP
jgi:hypothetical protein